MVYDNKLSGATASRRILYALVFTLVFEGVTRKLVPLAIGTVIFFVKDLLCIYGVFVVLNMRLDKFANKIATIWRKVVVAFFPLTVYAFILDPPLALFGTKQYVLYIVVALLVSVAFQNNVKGLKLFFLITASLLIPTTLVAILQNILPPTHWLNRGVGGTDLEMFSAAGHLRVSSTFSFTGQYSFFLNVVSAFYAACLFMQLKFKKPATQAYMMLYLALLGVMLMIGAFITGGRTAVLGCGACLFLGFALTGWRYPQWLLTKGIVGLLLAVLAFSAVRVAKPEYFEAYDARSSGNEEQTHSEEIENRLFDSFLGVGWLFDTDFSTIVVGQGIGVMTNGSAQVSSYANRIRSTGFWTESDVATTIWEGGLYLVVVWYTLRLYIIYFCYRNWMAIRQKQFVSGAAFFLAYVIIIGIIGTLGIQSPMAIYWWMCVGCVLAIRKYDAYLQQQKKDALATKSLLESPVAPHEEIISV